MSLFAPLEKDAMRRATASWILHLTLLLSLGVTACTSPAAVMWEKAGIDESTRMEDILNCQSEARSQAARLYPYFAYTPGSDAPTTGEARSRDERGQAAAENRDFVRCMRNKGYGRASPQRE